MEEVNAKNLSEMRRQKKKRRNTQKFLGFMIILTIVLGLYVSKERWMPDIKHQNSVFTDDELAEGEFPIHVSNTSSYKMRSVGDAFALLTDTRLYMISLSGDIIDARQHTYSNTILKSSGNKTLIYEQNGNNLRVDNKREMLYDKKTDASIYLASVNEKGYTAVVTASDQYVCELAVYNQSGFQIYSRGCSERITDVVFDNDGSGCSIVTIKALEGHIVSEITSIKFETTEDIWKISDIETCSVSAYVSSNDETVLFGDNMCGFYKNGEKIFEYTYPDTLVDASYSDSGAAMIFRNRERKKTTLVIISNPASGTAVEVTVSDVIKHVLACDDNIFFLTENYVESYDYEGKIVKKYELNEPYRDFYRSGKYIILQGHNKVERIEL